MKRINSVVATRVLDLRGTEKKVTIKVGKPRQTEDGPIYHCLYQILGIGDNKVRRSPGGLDSIHALQLAFQKVGVDLYVMNDSYNGALVWEGGDDDLGFPLPENLSSILKS